MKKLYYLLALGLCIMLKGCGWYTSSVDDINDVLLIFPKTFEMSTFSSGKLDKTVIISENDKLYKESYDLLNKNRGDWVVDINSYAPDVLLSSEFLNMNLMDTIVVINYTLDKGETWRQKSFKMNY